MSNRKRYEERTAITRTLKSKWTSEPSISSVESTSPPQQSTMLPLRRQSTGMVELHPNAVGTDASDTQRLFENENDDGGQKTHHSSVAIPDNSGGALPLLPTEQPPERENSSVHVKSERRVNAGFSERSEFITLPHDTFSFIISKPYLSIPSLLGFLVFAVKTAIWALMIGNIISIDENTTNVFGVPAAVNAAVLIAQLIAIFIAALTQEDFLSCLSQVYEGYSEDSVRVGFPEATRTKWALVLCMTFLAGASGLVVTFILMIISDDVIELLLNFTAVEFVAFLDNSAFALAVRGFLGRRNLRAAMEIVNTQFPRRATYGATRIYELAIFSLVLLSLLTGWAFVYSRQVAGYYAKSTIYVQFGDDEENLGLGMYSGMYNLESKPNWSLGGISFEYYEDQGSGVFGYCNQQEMWTFRLGGTDSCKDFLARSSQTSSSQITSTSTEWSVISKASPTRFHPMQSFYMTVGCLSDDDCGGTDRGYCTENQCFCNDGYYGLRCDYIVNRTCTKLVIDEAGDPFISNSRTFSDTFDILLDDNGEFVLVYHHPVYFYPVNDGIEVMLYTGLRWVLLLASENRGLANLTDFTSKGLANYFLNTTVEVRNRLIGVELASVPIFFDTPSDDAPTPLGLYWFMIRNGPQTAEIAGASHAILICGICSAFAQCLYAGVCLPTGVCECANGTTGTLCQIIPVGDGHCDVFFNEPINAFDNGDCCQSTCVSSSESLCGIESFGQLEEVRIGFPYCQDPKVHCGDYCWSKITQPVSLLSRTGSWPLVQLSSNGQIMILSEPDLDAVRLFDLSGSQWIQRGPRLSGPRGSFFGMYFDLATVPGMVFSQRFGLIPVALALGVQRTSSYGVQVFRFETNDIDWRFVGDEIEVCSLMSSSDCDVESLSIGQDKDRVVIAVALTDTVKVFETYLQAAGNEVWQPLDILGELNVTASVVSLAEDGTVCAVASQDTLGQVAVHPFGDEPYILDLNALLGREIVEILSLHLNYHGDAISTRFLYNENAASHDAFAILNLSDANKGAVVMDWADGNVIDAKFSGDGSSVAIQMETAERVLIRVTDFSLNSIDYNNDNLGLADFSISYDGSILAVSNEGGAQVLEATGAKCKNETLITLKIVMDERPEEVSWKVEAIQSIDGNITVIENVDQCDNCYDDGDRYSRTNIMQDLCYPTDCLRLTYQAPRGHRGGAGFVVFVDGKHIFTFDDGSQEEQVVYLNRDYIDRCGETRL